MPTDCKRRFSCAGVIKQNRRTAPSESPPTAQCRANLFQPFHSSASLRMMDDAILYISYACCLSPIKMHVGLPCPMAQPASK